MDAGVVEEVVPVPLALTGRGVFDDPGGIDWKLSVLLTTTVMRACSPAATCSVMSASKGV
jgi:hypothetical protein